MKNIPTEVSEEMYNDVKSDYINHTNKYEDYIIGYVGTCCSFGGSWFNGYARFNPNKNEDHIKEAYNGLKKQVENFIGLKKTVFLHCTYDRVLLHKNDIVYCDPPYASTKKYESDFDNDAFWEWAREASKKVKKLYISEYDAPSDFKCIWQMEKKDSLGTQKGKKQNTKVEKLFVYKGK
jgi:DNA adenine methylase